jgi:hypothetical protein
MRSLMTVVVMTIALFCTSGAVQAAGDGCRMCIGNDCIKTIAGSDHCARQVEPCCSCVEFGDCDWPCC